MNGCIFADFFGRCVKAGKSAGFSGLALTGYDIDKVQGGTIESDNFSKE